MDNPKTDKTQKYQYGNISLPANGIIFIAYFLAFTPKAQNSPKITQKLPNILKKFQNFLKFVKIAQKMSKLSKLPKRLSKNVEKFWEIFSIFLQFLGDFRTILGFGSECKKVSYKYNAIVAGREMFPYWYFWVLSAWGLSMIIVA